MSNIDESQISQLLRGLEIPPCPALLSELSTEIRREGVGSARIAELINRDVALSGGVLKVANSPLFRGSRKISSVRDALAMLGIKNVLNLVINELLRKTLNTSKIPMSMERFWDRSAHTAKICADLTSQIAGTSRDAAYSFGLFHDCGIPIMMRRFDGYKDTLKLANQSGDGIFTAQEESCHGTNHAVIGYLMARNWALPENVAQAVLVHHDYSIFEVDAKLPDETLSLVAISFIAERIAGIHLRSTDDSEWVRGQSRVANFLGMLTAELEDVVEDFLQRLEFESRSGERAVA